MNKNSTLEDPLVIQIGLGEIGPFTPFKVLTCLHYFPKTDLDKLEPVQDDFPCPDLQESTGLTYITCGTAIMVISWDFEGKQREWGGEDGGFYDYG